MKRILVVAAHPDDDILGCAATLDKYLRNGSEVRVIFLAEGTTCRYDDAHALDAVKEIEKRTAFGKDALKHLGVQSHYFYDLPCGMLDTISQLKINKIIESEIKSFQPSCIFTHWWADTNSDHKCTFNSVITATRPTKKQYVNIIYCFEILSSTEWNFVEQFKANYYECITKESIQKKIFVMKKYLTEMNDFPHPRSEEAIINKAKVRGSEVGCSFAEAFHLVRWINK